MNTVLESQARGVSVQTTASELIVHFEDGRTLTVPLVWYPRLAYGTSEERAHVEILGSGVGLYWPSLDEELSVEGLLAGRKTQEPDASFAQWCKEMDRRRKIPNPQPWGEELPMPAELDA